MTLNLKHIGLAAFALTAAMFVAPLSARADDAQAVAATQSATSVDVTVFNDGFAQIEETRQVTLTAGRNRIQLNGIAAKYRQDSLRIIDATGTGQGGFTFKSATYQPPTLTFDRILELSVGKPCKAKVGTGANARTVSGTLTSVRGGAAIVTANDGATFLAAASDIEVPSLPAGLSNTASLVIEADATAAGTYTLHFLYETEGVTWTAKHSLVYDEPSKNIESFETTVNVVNQSGTSFENANLWLLAGAVQNRGNVRAANYARSETMDAAPGGAAAESVGERKVYRIPGKISLVDNQSRQIPLFAGKNVAVTQEFFLAANSYTYDASAPISVGVRLELKNCSEHNLGTPLPAGQVKVYQRNSESKLQLTATTQVKELARDEVFTLNIGTSSDVKAERVLDKTTTVAGQPQPRNAQPTEYEDQQYTVRVHNFKDKRAVDVTVEVNTTGVQDIAAPLTRKNAALATTSVSADAGKEGTVTYTLRVRTR